MTTVVARITAKRRVKRAAEQALSTSTFVSAQQWTPPATQQPAPQPVAATPPPSVLPPSGPTRSADHSWWILNGLWPPELHEITPTTELLADQLEADLLRIAADANLALWQSSQNDPGRTEFTADELYVLNVARSLATLRVAEAVRHLRVGQPFPVGQLPPGAGYFLPR